MGRRELISAGWAVTLAVFAAASPAIGQRGGGARGGPVAHGSASFGSPRGFGQAPAFRYTGTRSQPANSFLRYPASGASTQRGSIYRPPYRGAYGRVVPGFFPWFGGGVWPYAPVLSGFDDGPYDNAGPGSGPAATGDYPVPPAGEIFNDVYQPQGATGQEISPRMPGAAESSARSERETEPAPAERVTLVYKDGRTPEQIQNYLATSTTITVMDGPRHRSIAIADLDVPATVAANQKDGVDFELPGLPVH